MHSRRHFLKLSMAALLASLSAKLSTQSAHGKKNLQGKTVVVVGAGIAGLSAAKTLQAYGAKVIVLEAGDYIGGRIRTNRSMGAPFEYGAGWIHGPSEENPIQQLAKQVHAQTFVTDDDSLEIFDANGTSLPEADYERLDGIYRRLSRKLYRVSRGDRRSIEAAIADMEPELLQDPLARWLLSAFIEFDMGAGIEDISAANVFSDDAFDGDDVIFTQGYDCILKPLMEGLDIRLNTPVSQIHYQQDHVKVNNLAADYLICTVPLGVLKGGTIRFNPPLPNKLQEAISSLGFGTVTKIALQFDQAFWDTETQYFGVMTEPKGRWNYWLNYRTFSDKNILLGLSFGRYAPVADQMTPAEMTRDALDVLRSVWGKRVGEPLSVLTTHWSEDPHFKGAYSYSQAGGSAAQYEIFAQPIAGQLFFAGEHTIFEYHGTTHGALLSGLRAAEQIIDH